MYTDERLAIAWQTLGFLNAFENRIDSCNCNQRNEFSGFSVLEGQT